jgi:hypothetical protein
MGTKCGMKGGPTMVGLEVVMRACCCRRCCCCCPPPLESWIGVHVDGPSARVVEGGPRGWGRASLAAMALVALVRSNGTALLPRSWP